jgi:hypothetical protein
MELIMASIQSKKKSNKKEVRAPYLSLLQEKIDDSFKKYVSSLNPEHPAHTEVIANAIDLLYLYDDLPIPSKPEIQSNFFSFIRMANFIVDKNIRDKLVIRDLWYMQKYAQDFTDSPEKTTVEGLSRLESILAQHFPIKNPQKDPAIYETWDYLISYMDKCINNINPLNRRAEALPIEFSYFTNAKKDMIVKEPLVQRESEFDHIREEVALARKENEHQHSKKNKWIAWIPLPHKHKENKHKEKGHQKHAAKEIREEIKEETRRVEATFVKSSSSSEDESKGKWREQPVLDSSVEKPTNSNSEDIFDKNFSSIEESSGSIEPVKFVHTPVTRRRYTFDGGVSFEKSLKSEKKGEEENFMSR